MNAARYFVVAIWLCFLTSIGLPVAAQPSGFTKLNVKGRVQLEIPSDWTILDGEQRKRIQEEGAKLAGVAATHVASLAAQSYPAPSRALVRVSFLGLNPPITQAEVRQEVQSNRQQVLKDLGDVWRQEAPLLWAGLAKMGVKEVGAARFDVESLGGQTALVISYGRTSTAMPGQTMRVTQYHVLLGTEKALITLSYIEGDPQATAMNNRVKNSVTIR